MNINSKHNAIFKWHLSTTMVCVCSMTVKFVRTLIHVLTKKKQNRTNLIKARNNEYLRDDAENS